MGKRAVLAIVGIMTLTLLISSFAFAGEREHQVKKISLDQAINLAMENNTDLKLARLAVDKAEVAYDRAKDMAETMQDKRDLGKTLGTLEEEKVISVYPRQALMGLNIAQKVTGVTEKSTRLAVQNAYYEVLKNEKLLQVKQMLYKQAQEQVRLAEANYRVKRFAKVDVDTAKVMAASAKAKLLGYETQYKVTVLNFNKLVGLDVDTQVKLTGKLEYKPLNDLDLEASIKDALKNSVEMVQAKEQAEVSELELATAEKYFPRNVYSTKEKVIAAKEAELKLQRQEVDTRIAVKAAYLSLRTAEEKIKVLSKSLEQQKENLRIVTLKYKAGMATNTELSDANIALEQAEQQYAEAVFDYNLARAKFENGLFFTTNSARSTISGPAEVPQAKL